LIANTVHMQLSEEAMTANPHPMFAAMRQAGPAMEIPIAPGVNGWLVTRYEDARRALNDPRLAKAPTASILPPEMVKPGLSKHMLNGDAPEHTRLRKLVSMAFTPRRMEALRPRVQEISNELIAAMEGKEVVDLIDDYAFPLPFQVICELIGVPMVDRDSFREWSNILIDQFAAGSDRAIQAAESMVTYVQDLVERKRSDPDDALLTALINASDEGDRLDQDELTSMVFLLLVAGHETTVNLIGNAMYLLLGKPDLASQLRANPGQIPGAIEEVLRYESPVKTSTMRISVAPVEMGDVTIPPGQVVFISLLSANRDEKSFSSPDEMDVFRKESQHLAFGHGIHFCLGAPLARIEAQIALTDLLTAFPNMSADSDLAAASWRPGLIMRGVEHLPVRLGTH
jgi:cytochrome P450